jgi:hypothetical protein
MEAGWAAGGTPYTEMVKRMKITKVEGVVSKDTWAVTLV